MNLNFFLKKELKSVLSSKKRAKTFNKLESTNTVLLLFDKQDWLDVEKIISNLESEGKEVFAWSINHNKKSENEVVECYPENVRFINTKTDLTWKKTLKPEIITEFTNLDYEICLDLTTSDDLYLYYLLALVNNKFTIGLKETDRNLHDFIILKKTDSDLFETYEQIKYYLSKLK